MIQNKQTNSTQLERKISQQNSKINFLQQEVFSLHQQVQDLEEMLKISKEALSLSLSLSPMDFLSSSLSKKKSDVSTADKTKSITTQVKESNASMLIEKLVEENNFLKIMISKIQRDLNEAQGKALVNEQIAEQAQRHEIELSEEFEQKIIELQNFISQKENFISQMEQKSLNQQNEETAIQYKEVAEPKAQNMKWHEQIEQIKLQLAKTQGSISKLQSQKQELLNINFNLANEIYNLKNGSYPLDSKANKLDASQQMQTIFELHKQFLQSESEIDENFDGLSGFDTPLPNKVFGPNDNLNEPQEMKSNLKPIPKLDLTKAKQIQDLNAKRSTQNYYQKTQVDPTKLQEQLKKLETELEKTKRQLSQEMISNKIMVQQINNLERMNKQLISENEIIMKANHTYDDKWKKYQKIFPQLQFYKSFYDEFHELIELYKKDFQVENQQDQSQLAFDQLLDFDMTSLSKIQSGIYKQCFSQIKLSKLEKKQLELATIKSLNYESSKCFLLKLSQQLYLNSNFQQFCQNPNIFFTNRKQHLNPKLKHSNSNFLDAYSADQQFSQLISENGININNLNCSQEPFKKLPVMTRIMKNNEQNEQNQVISILEASGDVSFGEDDKNFI